MPSRLSQYASRVLEAGWLLAVILVPLFFNVWSNRVFEPDKLALLRSLALVMVAASAVRWLEHGGGRIALRNWLQKPMVLPVAAMTGAMTLSSVTSIVPRLSFFGSYNRLQGLYTWLAYVVLFLALVTTLRHREQLERLTLALILPSLPVGLYGIVQKFGLDPMPWLGDVTRRVASTMGNSIFVAAYLIMAVPLTVVQLIAALRALDRDESHAAVLRVSGYLVLLAVQVMAVVFAQSRGPLLGLLGGGFFLLLVIAARRGRSAAWAVLGLGAATAAFLVVFNLPHSPLAALRDAPYLGRMGRVFETDRSTGRVRVLIWEGAIELVRADRLRAVIGYGPESMHVAYNPYYPPDLAHYESRNASPDRSHNETLDVLVQTGSLGLLASLYLFTALFYYGLKWLGLIAEPRHRRQFLALWLGGGFAVAGGFCAWTKSATFLGVAFPAGLVAGLLLFVALRVMGGWQPGVEPTRLVLAALVASLLAHYIEIHFGIAIAATRTLFFVMLGTMVAVGAHLATMEAAADEPGIGQSSVSHERERRSRQLTSRDRRARRGASGSANGAADWLTPGFLTLAMTTTLVYDLLVVTQAQRSSFWLVLAWILGLCWAIGSLILATELLVGRPGGRQRFGDYLWVSLAGTVVYTAVHVFVLWGGSASGGGPGTSSALLTLFYVTVAAELLAWAYALVRRETASVVAHKPPWVYAILAGIVGVVALLRNFNEVRADIYYKSAYFSYHDAANKADDRGEHERARALYAMAQKHYDKALALDPAEDYYLLFKGKGLLEEASGLADVLRADLGDRVNTAGFSEYDLPAEDRTLADQVDERDATFQAAIDVLERARVTGPRNTDHYANLGRAFQVWGDETFDPEKRAQRLAESRRWFEAAVQLSPNNAQLREEMATTLYLAGDVEAALRRIEEALAIDPEYGRPYRLRGTIRREAKDYEAAAADYQAYVQTKDGRGDAYGWSALAYVLGQLDRLAEARQANEKVLELVAPREDLSTLRNLVLLCRDLGDVAAACDYLARGLALEPEDAGFLALAREMDCPGVDLPASETVTPTAGVTVPHSTAPDGGVSP